MRLTPRIRRLERQHFHRLSAEDQRSLLQGFIQAETMVRSQPPSAEEIEAERARLAQPVRKPTREQIDTARPGNVVEYAPTMTDKNYHADVTVLYNPETERK